MNLETDILAKYVEKQLAGRLGAAQQSTTDPRRCEAFLEAPFWGFCRSRVRQNAGLEPPQPAFWRMRLPKCFTALTNPTAFPAVSS